MHTSCSELAPQLPGPKRWARRAHLHFPSCALRAHLQAGGTEDALRGARLHACDDGPRASLASYLGVTVAMVN